MLGRRIVDIFPQSAKPLPKGQLEMDFGVFQLFTSENN
jgi:hypothetical protein